MSMKGRLLDGMAIKLIRNWIRGIYGVQKYFPGSHEIHNRCPKRYELC